MLTPLYYTPFVMLPDSQHLASILVKRIITGCNAALE
jgi:hypothetical protein